MADPIGDAALDTLFRTARSQNGWLDRKLPEGTLQKLWSLVAMGPTSANCEPARIVWCVTREARERLAACVSEKNAPKILAAPATAVIGHDLRFYDRLPELFPHVDARPWFTSSEAFARETAMRNGSLQGGYLILAARALGLDAGPMSGFDADKVAEAFFAGTTVRPNFICSIGYGDPDKVFERLPRLAFEDANTVV
jgi:3-hydroxypropanoate dehydrogenase